MKRFFSLSALLLAITFLLFNSNSFTTAEIKNDATLSMVSEEDALIAINYEEGAMFTVTNNTEKAIEIESLQLSSSSDNDISISGSESIRPGGSSTFMITRDPEQLSDTSIQLVARWSDGGAEIQSLIPETAITQWVEDLKSKDMTLIKMTANVKICEEKATSDIDEENATPEIDGEKTTPEVDVEKSNPEKCKEVEVLEDIEITTPEINPKQIGPESIEIQPILELNDEQ